MGTDKKLYIALGVLVVLGGVLYLQRQERQKELQSYSLESRRAELPKLELSDEQADKIDKIVIDKPAGDDGGAKEQFVLQKSGDEWKLMKPVEAPANQDNVKSLFENVKRLEVMEEIATSADVYARYDLTEDKATHVTLYQGAEPVQEFWFGESGGRGRMARLKGKESVYALKGFSEFVYNRDMKGWRNRSIFKFEDAKVKSVSIENENGSFEFEKQDGTWKASHKKAKTAPAKALEEFDEAKLKDMLRAYKSLNADGFGDEKQPGDVGLEEPAAQIVFTLEDGAKRELLVGDEIEDSGRWVKRSDKDRIVSISSWSAGWAVAGVEKFQKSKEGDPKPATVNPHQPPKMH